MGCQPLMYVSFGLFQIAGRDILSSIGREMSGDLEDGFKALGRFPFYLLQERLHTHKFSQKTSVFTLIIIISP